MENLNTAPLTNEVPSSSSVPTEPQIPATTENLSTSSISAFEQNENINVPKKKSKGPLIVLMSLLVVLLLIIGAGAFLALVAYGKVDIGDKELQRKISFGLQAIPFTPKTPEYLIYNTLDAQKNLKSAYIDASVALTGSQTIPGLGSNFDLKVVGPIDIHDKDHPKGQISLKVTPEIDADLVAVNDKFFFKINSLPAVIKGYAEGAGYPLDPFMMKWIVYDLKSLESDARDTLDGDRDKRDEETYNKVRTAILNSDIINKIQVKETTLDDKPVYQMTLELTEEEYMKFVNDIEKAVDPDAYSSNLSTSKSSQSFENIKIGNYIDKATMHTVRSTISFRLNTGNLNIPSQVLGASTIQYFPNAYTIATGQDNKYTDVAVVINTSKFNEDFDIKEPEGATPLEDIVKQYSEMMRQNEMKQDDSDGFGGTDAMPDSNGKPIKPDNGTDDSDGFSKF